MFVTKLNAAGSALVYSTFLGGRDFDSGSGLAVDAAGNAYVSGGAGSTDFPTTPGAFDTLPDGSDAFVTKLNPAGSALVYSTVLGGTCERSARTASCVDAAGNAWVTGDHQLRRFPGDRRRPSTARSTAWRTPSSSELSADGSTLLYSTYLGGTQSDGGDDIALDASGDVYVAGHTYSIDFPTTAGRLRHRLQRRSRDLLGRRLRHEAGHRHRNVDAAVDAAGAGGAEPASPANNDNPPQPITFQWSGASGAASYTIQIDDSSAFSAPLVREQQGLTVLMLCDHRPRDHAALLARARREHRRRGRRVVRGAQLHAAGRLRLRRRCRRSRPIRRRLSAEIRRAGRSC